MYSDVYIEVIAAATHEDNREYCLMLGDESQMPWEDAPEWQKDSVKDGVRFALEAFDKGEMPSPAASHENWLKYKMEEGWSYGEVKDAVKKTHPCMKPYEELPLHNKIKDLIFITNVFRCMKQLENVYRGLSSDGNKK